MNDYTDFIGIMEDYIRLFDELLPLAQTKLDAALKNQVTFVEDCMNKEQACVMRMRGLENKREAEQKRLGMEGCTFRQILEKTPDNVSETLEPLFARLSEQVRTYQSLTDNIKDAIDVNLHMIRSAAESSDSAKAYSPDGVRRNGGDNGHFTSRTV